MRALVVMVGAGALGLWAALRDVFPTTRHQRDWVPKTANVLPVCQGRCWSATTGQVAKAVARVVDDAEVLLMFFDFPASTGSTARPPIHRVHLLQGLAQDWSDQGPRLQGTGLAMAFKFLESAQTPWRAVNGPHLVALVRAGARFDQGGDGRAS